MNDYLLIAFVLLSCGILFLSIVFHKMEWIINYLLRLTFGIIGIYLINLLFQSVGYDIYVGVNEGTMLILGLLGAPGILCLYGLSVYFYLV